MSAVEDAGGCGVKKSCATKDMRLLRSAGNDALLALAMTIGRSCTVKVRLGNAWASAMDAWPVEPPTWGR